MVRRANMADVMENPAPNDSQPALDNQEARILVGQEVPVTTGEALSRGLALGYLQSAADAGLRPRT